MPEAVAGHSLGEYSALVAAGVLTLAQAAPLVRLRAAAMQEAVPVGAGGMAGHQRKRRTAHQQRGCQSISIAHASHVLFLSFPPGNLAGPVPDSGKHP